MQPDLEDATHDVDRVTLDDLSEVMTASSEHAFARSLVEWADREWGWRVDSAGLALRVILLRNRLAAGRVPEFGPLPSFITADPVATGLADQLSARGIDCGVAGRTITITARKDLTE